MKKIIFILMTVLPIVGYSQSIGLKGGLVFSSANYSKYVDEKVLTAPVFGLVYQQNFNRVSLSIEPGFTAKGFSDEYSFTDNDGNPKGTARTKFKFSYFEIPVLVGYNLIDKDLYLGLNAGLAPNFLLNAKVKSPDFNGDIKGSNGVLLDVVGGGYVGYKLSDNVFAALNVRYGKGLTKVHPDSDGTYSYFTTFLNIGYKF